MQVKDLQDALGLVMTDEGGLASFTRPKWAHAEAFGAQRQERLMLTAGSSYGRTCIKYRIVSAAPVCMVAPR